MRFMFNVYPPEKAVPLSDGPVGSVTAGGFVVSANDAKGSDKAVMEAARKAAAVLTKKLAFIFI